MKKIKKFLVVSVLALVVLFPESSSAYKTTEQTAVRLNENTILYTISYRFNFLNRDTYMPIMTKRETENFTSSPYLSYQIFDGEEVFNEGDVKALVLSKTKIDNSHYFSRAGITTDFMLVAILTLPQSVVNEGGDFSLKVKSLPIKTEIESENEEKNEVTQVDLSEYITPSIKI